MTETHATTPPRGPVFPPGRYGRRREPRRRRPWLLALLLVPAFAVAATVSVRLYRQYGDPTYQAKVITYTQITDSQIVVDFRVTVPSGGAADCVLRARSRDGAEVGREQVRVTAAPGEKHPVVSHRLATTARPLIGEVVRCGPVR
ncbi:protein of unknown function [Micromonospora pattaloongensis]|uniref:DUF4307 domain-containing protein n=1 Tax=Micromonospora pattaloongensis TaxID=405436 RepID=A0A1H3M869_9ACTN|nr:DUF4307 domain-containing protein [Micromonospora pattaloongensis]SDY72937.1 protein of unknown function [Micromonospora pattaloongensis]